MSNTSTAGYGYLLDITPTGTNGGDLSTAKTLVFFINENTLPMMWIADIRNKRFYFSYSYELINDISLAETAIELTEKETEYILKVYKDRNVTNWSIRYDGNNGDTTGSQSWFMLAELTDGTVQRSSGHGIFSGFPPEFSGLRKDLLFFTNDHKEE